jgi:phosphopantothenoylcysteine decarboxylase/phosphopantothenate--cysteine ligase
MASPEKQPLREREILVGVTGGIAAYKTAALVSRLVQAGAGVSVMMTGPATRLVGPATFQALTGRPVHTDLWAPPEACRADHIALADRAHLVVVAPATANAIGKLAAGIADDLVSTVLLAISVPLVLAPAMNVHMWQHPAVQANVETLRTRGVRLVGPEEGWLACGVEAHGRMAEPETIVAEIVKALATK